MIDTPFIFLTLLIAIGYYFYYYVIDKLIIIISEKINFVEILYFIF